MQDCVLHGYVNVSVGVGVGGEAVVRLLQG